MTVFPDRLETERLALVRYDDAVDARTVYDHRTANAEAGVYEHVPQSAFRTLKEARDHVADVAERWDAGEGARYAVYPRVDGDAEGHDDPGDDERDASGEDAEDGASLAGIADVHCEWDRRTGHPGVVLSREHWGRGYAGECFRALCALAFDRLDLAVVALSHRVGNERSRRAIEKTVERFDGTRDGLLRNWTPTDDGVADERRYTIRRERYRAATGE